MLLMKRILVILLCLSCFAGMFMISNNIKTEKVLQIRFDLDNGFRIKIVPGEK